MTATRTYPTQAPMKADARTAVTELAGLIGGDSTLVLRRSEVHVLLEALTGKGGLEDANTVRDLVGCLTGLLPSIADDADLRAHLADDAVANLTD